MLTLLLIMALVSPVTAPANEQTLMVRAVDIDECVDVSTGAVESTEEPADPGSGYLWEDDFDRYASAAAMIAEGSCAGGTDAAGLPSASVTYGQRTMPNSDDGCNLNNDNMSLTTGRGGSGKAIRSSVQTDGVGAQQNFTWLTPWDAASIGAYSGALVIQFYFRISIAGTPGTAGMKWLEAWDGSNRIQWALDRGTQTRPLWSAVLGSNPGGTVNRTTQPVAPFWDDVDDNDWHRFTALFKPNTSTTYSNTGGSTSADETYTGTSSRDGRIAAWIDGTKIMDYSQDTVGVTPSGGLNQWCYQGDVDMIPTYVIDYLKLVDVVNDSPGTWTLDHDDLKIWAVE